MLESPNYGQNNDYSLRREAPRHQGSRGTTGKTIGDIIDESLDFYGIKTAKSAAALVAKARQKAGLTEDEARKLAVEETRAVRQR